MDDRLKELKTLYKEMAASKPGDTRTAEIVDRLQSREEDLMTPHKCDAAYIYHPAGAALDEIESFTNELTEVVDKMKEELLNEQRLLEGTDVPEYNENELSQAKLTEEQWKSALPNGSLTTDLIPTSTQDSNSLSGFAELFNRNCPIPQLRTQSMNSPTSSCLGKLDDCGIEIDATNESSECTVPMISELTHGTPNEEKWSLPQKSMECSDPTLPDEM